MESNVSHRSSSAPAASDSRSRPKSAVAALTVALLLLLPVMGIDSAPSALGQPAGSESPCAIVASVGGPEMTLLGARTGFTVGARTICAGELPILNVVFVIDGSGEAGATDQEFRDSPQKQAALLKRIGRDLARSIHANAAAVSFGVVEYRDEAHVLCDLTDDLDETISCINRVAAVGDANPVAGVERGAQLLGEAPDVAPGTLPVLVVLTGSPMPDECEPLVSAVAAVRPAGILPLGACVGPSCDSVCLGRAFGDLDFSDDPMAIARDINQLVLNIRVESLAITATVVGGLEPIPDSLEPPGSVTDRTLTWQIPAEKLAEGGGRAVVAFDVLPGVPGAFTEPVTAQIDFVDTKGRTGGITVTHPSLAVLQPTVVPPSPAIFIPWAERP